MPVSISIHESGQYMVARFSGKIADGEVRPAYESFYKNHEVPVNFPELCDLAAADMSGWTHAGMTAFARWVQELFHDRGETARKTAYFLPGLIGKSKVILYETMMQDSPEITRTFSRLDDAVRWLADSSPDSTARIPTR